MSKWEEYQNFSTTAKKYGGANDYLNFLENTHKNQGRNQGRIETAIILGVLTTAGILIREVAVPRVKKAIQNRNAQKKAERLASVVRQELLNNVAQYDENNHIELEKMQEVI